MPIYFLRKETAWAVQVCVRVVSFVAFLALAVGVPAMVTVFTVVGEKSVKRVYCKSTTWYLDVFSGKPELCEDDTRTLAKKAYRGMCVPHLSVNHPVVSTITSVIEFWPYVACFVIGAGVASASTVFLFVCMARDLPWLAFVSCLAPVLCFGVVGTSIEWGDDYAWLGYLHIVTAIVLIGCMCACFLALDYFTADDVLGSLGRELVVVMLLSALGALIGGIGSSYAGDFGNPAEPWKALTAVAEVRTVPPM